jgi:hypothetical protein
MAGHGETPKKIGRIDRSSYHDAGPAGALWTPFPVTLKRADGYGRRYEETKLSLPSLSGWRTGRQPGLILVLFFVSSFLRFFAPSSITVGTSQRDREDR